MDDDVAARWAARDVARHYRQERFGARSGRDPAAVRRIIGRALVAAERRLPVERVLDVPSGTGRLRPVLEALAERYVAADASRAMLAEAPARGGLQAALPRLPFASASFDVVVCCRLLHHFEDPAAVLAALRELLRVSRGLVVASFWDSASWPAWKRRHGRTRRREGRIARSRAELERLARAAGAREVRFRPPLRFLAQQTFVVLEPVPVGR